MKLWITVRSNGYESGIFINSMSDWIVGSDVLMYSFNPFPHIDAFWRLCSRQLFENMATKEEIAQNKQFLLLSPCFQLYSIIILYFIDILYILTDNFNVVSCRFVPCGKGLSLSIEFTSYSWMKSVQFSCNRSAWEGNILEL